MWWLLAQTVVAFHLISAFSYEHARPIISTLRLPKVDTFARDDMHGIVRRIATPTRVLFVHTAGRIDYILCERNRLVHTSWDLDTPLIHRAQVFRVLQSWLVETPSFWDEAFYDEADAYVWRFVNRSNGTELFLD